MEGQTMLDYSYKVKDKCQVMSTMNQIKIDDAVVPVDPQLLFQRLSIAVSRDPQIDLKDVFKYELSTSPAALFSDNDGLMREANKPQLAIEIWNHVSDPASVCVLPDNVAYVLDGGYLLQKIQGWTKGKTFCNIIQLYIDYVKRYYGAGTVVVFDGGYDKPSTKDSTHLRRTKFKKGKEVKFSKNMSLNMKKEDFLLNRRNKQHFLELLCEEFNSQGLLATQSSCDADYDIVKTAIRSSEVQPTVLIGDDTDLLCLLLYHSTENNEIYFTAEQKSNMEKPKIWDIKATKQKLGEDICKRILLVHALLGCDTTSRVFGVNKATAFKVLKNKDFCITADVFLSNNSKPDDVITAGEELLLIVLGAKGEKSLDDFRQVKFSQKLATSTRVVLPETLGPTSNAASFHSLRVYLQVQQWIGVQDIDPLSYGLVLKNDYILPIRMSKPAAPPYLLKMIMCGCKGECQSRCTCFKYKLKCTAMCTNCRGVSCLNCSEPMNNDEDPNKSQCTSNSG